MDYRHSHFHFEAKHIGDKTVLIASYCKFSFFLWLPFSLKVWPFANCGERKMTRSWRICWCSRSFLQTLNYPTSPFSLKVVIQPAREARGLDNRPKTNVNKVPRLVFRYVSNKTFDFSSKKRIFCPETTKFGPNLAFLTIAGSFGALLMGWLVVVARGLYLARHLFTL